ncbi:MAG: His-Xaa-Ser system radical SAM maturase HxsB [Oceanicaulis sp.]|jgi:His-Xaa-Ser system radical SAM maturase HxsB|nr:His-Xaa-Ser system radical SAM maturase HxsB [Oceanicaulis sp.]
MSLTAPLRFHELSRDRLLFVDDTGSAFTSGEAFLDRLALDQLTSADQAFLQQEAFTTPSNRLESIAQLRGLADRFARTEPLSYFIVVPTLRCDLRCGYCQVSRVNADRQGFDWTREILENTARLIDQAQPGPVQIEFQGGEPLLRTDLIETLICIVSERRPGSRFVLCTNLSEINVEAWRLFEREDVYISTSLDGPRNVHQKNRTANVERTDRFFDNLSQVIRRCGIDRVSALPTIDYRDPPSPREIIETYSSFGLRSIYLRPVNYQGFARKAHSSVRADAASWNAYHRSFVEEMIAFNAETDTVLEEYYLTTCLKRCLRSGENSHVDLRNPNRYGIDYIVVDYDGAIYPTDEARMLSRSGVIDLRIGDVSDGFEPSNPTLNALNAGSANNLDPDCIHCAFQAACGVDLIDDISRYGRRDLPRPDTFFCQRQTAMFDLAWKLLLDRSPAIRHSVCAWLDIPFTDQALIPHHD